MVNQAIQNTTSKNAFVLKENLWKASASAHAVEREYKVITALNNTDVPLKTYGLCEDPSVIGTTFFVMEFLDGTVLWDHLLPDKTKEQRELIYKNKNKTLALLHNVNYKKSV